jgi:probable rRNA maturation factor
MNIYFDEKSQYDELIKKCCEAVIAEENYAEEAEVSFTFVADEEIRELNSQYRGIDKPTDVLSFPINELNPDTNAINLGDIIISGETASRQAVEYNHSKEREIAFLTIHGMLHLLGYDHEESEEAEKNMREKQTNILDGLELGIVK